LGVNMLLAAFPGARLVSILAARLYFPELATLW